MVLVKVLKNKAFFKRYQVPRRRRREGKTDYYARRKMIAQDKSKYNNRKYRYVVRFTNKRVIIQVVYATIVGDHVATAADSTELKKYGIDVGLTNYAAAYATGLLVARRTLQKFQLDSIFSGKEEIDGEEYHVEQEADDRRPFKCILDVGLRRTTVGARLWGALKGGVDGGLHIPHTQKSFPGYRRNKEGEDEYEADVHKAKIFGRNVADYMESLKEDDEQKYEAQFSQYIKAGKEPDDLEEMYAEAHKRIRADPTFTNKEKKVVTWKRTGVNTVESSSGKTVQRYSKISLQQRKMNVGEKIKAAQQAMEDEEDE